MCRLFGVEQCHLSPLRTLCLSLCCHAHAPGMGAGNSIPCQVGNSAFLLDGALLGAAGGEKVRVCVRRETVPPSLLSALTLFLSCLQGRTT